MKKFLKIQNNEKIRTAIAEVKKIVYFFAIDKLYVILQMFTVLSIPVFNEYNGERGKWKGMKWLFYIYYPAHLFVIGIIRVLMGSNGIFP